MRAAGRARPGQHGVDEMRRLPRHRELLTGHDRQLDLPAIAGIVAVMCQPHAARAARARREGSRQTPSARRGWRTLRNHRERQRFAEGDAIGRFAEIQPACGADALDVAAERHDVQIRFEQLALRIARLEPEGNADLAKLSGRCPGIQSVDQPRQLHRERRSALARAAAIRAECRAHERDRIDAGVPVEPAILLQQKRLDERRRDVGERHPQPVLIVGRARHAQQLAVGRPHAGRQRDTLCERGVRPASQQRARAAMRDENRRRCSVTA